MAMEKHQKEDYKFAMTTHKPKGGDQQRVLCDPLAFDPFESLGALWQGPFSIFQNFCASGTRVDWKETADHHIFKADIPGVKKDDVKISVENGNMLQILGQKRQDDIDDSATWHRVERNQNKFLRRFQLPGDARLEGMISKVEHGVLTITVPKDKNYKPPPRNLTEIPIHWEMLNHWFVFRNEPLSPYLIENGAIVIVPTSQFTSREGGILIRPLLVLRPGADCKLVGQGLLCNIEFCFGDEHCQKNIQCHQDPEAEKEGLTTF